MFLVDVTVLKECRNISRSDLEAKKVVASKRKVNISVSYANEFTC